MGNERVDECQPPDLECGREALRRFIRLRTGGLEPLPADASLVQIFSKDLEHFTRSRVLSGLAAGSYKVGLCMQVFPAYGTWFDADNVRKGQTTALVFN